METETFPYLEAELKENILDPRHRLLIIDKKFISYDDKIMACDDITGIRYGNLQMTVFHKVRTGIYHKIDLKDKHDNEIKIFFGHSKISGSNNNLDENYDKIIDALWYAVKKRLVNEALEHINKGNEYTVGNCRVMKNGIKIIPSSLFFKKEYFIPWEIFEKKLGFGYFTINSIEHKRLKCKINFLHTWNSVVLFSMLEFLQRQNQSKSI